MDHNHKNTLSWTHTSREKLASVAATIEADGAKGRGGSTCLTTKVDAEDCCLMDKEGLGEAVMLDVLKNKESDPEELPVAARARPPAAAGKDGCATLIGRDTDPKECWGSCDCID